MSWVALLDHGLLISLAITDWGTFSESYITILSSSGVHTIFICARRCLLQVGWPYPGTGAADRQINHRGCSGTVSLRLAFDWSVQARAFVSRRFPRAQVGYASEMARLRLIHFSLFAPYRPYILEYMPNTSLQRNS